MSDEEKKNEEYGNEPQVLGLVNHSIDLLIKLAVLAVFLFALFYGTRTAYQFGYSVFTTKPAEDPPGTDIEVTILAGMTKQSVGSLLAGSGVVRNATVFYVQAVIYGYDIVPGKYVLNSSQQISDILMTLSRGPDEESK